MLARWDDEDFFDDEDATVFYPFLRLIATAVQPFYS